MYYVPALKCRLDKCKPFGNWVLSVASLWYRMVNCEGLSKGAQLLLKVAWSQLPFNNNHPDCSLHDVGVVQIG